jgi:triphosphoribosyl-dephospho-CoA synthase
VLHRAPQETSARPDALLAVMARLDDTCLLHRGGRPGLALIRQGAARVLAGGGTATAPGRRRLAELDCAARAQGLSPGGSADLLAAALFLDSFPAVQGRMETDADARV